MKILKQAATDGWSYKFTCGECESELQADAGDLTYNHYEGDFREPSYDTWSVNCPVCSYSTGIHEEKIPKVIRIKIKQKRQMYSGGPFDR